MNQYEAYPTLPSYSERASRRYRVGALVELGPAYVGNNRYAYDGFSGPYYVVKTCASGECGLSRHHDGDLEVWVHPSRLTPMDGKNS